jgi:predicted dehydrogenase
MQGAPLRVGLVGGNPERGWATLSHVPALKALAGFTLEGVSARTLANAEAAAAAYGAARAYGDSLELARSPDIDVVAVSVKVPEHFAVVTAALEANKHVYCEWPLGRNVQEAEALATLAARTPSSVIIGTQGTGIPLFRQAVEILNSGSLGRLRSARVISPFGGFGREVPSFNAYVNRRASGATPLSIPGGHTLAVVLMTLGAYTEVQAQATLQHPKVTLVDTGEIIDRDCPELATGVRGPFKNYEAYWAALERKLAELGES